LNSNPRHLGCLTFILCFVGESCCLSCGVQVAGAACRATTRIMVGVEDLMQRTGNGRTGWVLGGRVIERLDGAVCDLHRACGDEKREFLG
jgi:hypothetical protein